MDVIIVTKTYTTNEQTSYIKVWNLNYEFPVLIFNCLSISILFSVQ